MPYPTQAKRTIFITIGLVSAIIVTFFLSLNWGTIKIAPIDVLQAFAGKGTEQNMIVLFDFRLPRMVIAMLIGAGLAVSGAILQGVAQNGLADPGILGINSGAGLAVVLFIFFFQQNLNLPVSYSIFIMPFAALLGACLAAFLIYVIAWKKGGVTPTRLILVGIGINSAFSALIIVFQLKMDPQDFMQATIWLSGNIGGTDWTYVLAILPWILILIPFAIYKARYLNVLTMGDSIAKGLGTDVEKERRKFLLISVALAGACVSVGGGIAFLGLVAPHLTRMLVGPRHERLIPISALVGAFLLLFSDMLARNVLAPSEIPVGLVVSALGAPYFIYLLIKS
ncbi:iron ABC transporter permease [Bacillus sp. AFS040349]|uniref:FecCD family ABC transporter permease n=1 Tax=Bacillus sp. AFS040349 TaxID=2033502 RepID=UPI000BFE3E9B|nr:iron ABC transporter permease [Bacillus sp. AFS040349]PGT76740.1 iron ABC transporter permease [Bacillus sp. AFS040349]